MVRGYDWWHPGPCAWTTYVPSSVPASQRPSLEKPATSREEFASDVLPSLRQQREPFLPKLEEEVVPRLLKRCNGPRTWVQAAAGGTSWPVEIQFSYDLGTDLKKQCTYVRNVVLECIACIYPIFFVFCGILCIHSIHCYWYVIPIPSWTNNVIHQSLKMN